MTEGFIALGSNLQSPIKQVLRAASLLQETPDIEAFQLSGLYHTPPMGNIEQPDFINAVCRFRTSMSALELLKTTQSIEQKMRRKKEVRWGPRLIDLDVLLLGQQAIQTPLFTLPHCGLLERDFVLVPLYDVAPELILPNGHLISKWLETFKPFKLRRIESTELENVSCHSDQTTTL